MNTYSRNSCTRPMLLHSTRSLFLPPRVSLLLLSLLFHNPPLFSPLFFNESTIVPSVARAHGTLNVHGLKHSVFQLRHPIHTTWGDIVRSTWQPLVRSSSPFRIRTSRIGSARKFLLETISFSSPFRPSIFPDPRPVKTSRCLFCV